MEADEKLKKDWDTVQKTSESVRERSKKHQERLQSLGEDTSSLLEKAQASMQAMRKRAAGSKTAAAESMKSAAEKHEALGKAQEAFRSGFAASAEKTGAILSWTKEKFHTVVDQSSAAVSFMGDESQKADKLKQWKAAREGQAAAAAKAAEAAEQAAAHASSGAPVEGAAADGAAPGAEQAPSAEPAHALVVSQASDSSWDRFGSRLRDMPFLSSAFDNPLFDRVFGESEIAASIREMKEIDYRFQLEEFAEEIEFVVAPHIIKSFLEADQEALKKHCGEAAFAAVNASIKARKSQRLTLDPKVLAGPNEVELKGAKLMDKGAPYFIWTFQTQQVNCLRDKEGTIIEGAVDDIRTVVYAMAVTKHPDIEKYTDLEYPWQISELAILGNQPCW